jgi:hypothetical protein
MALLTAEQRKHSEIEGTGTSDGRMFEDLAAERRQRWSNAQDSRR